MNLQILVVAYSVLVQFFDFVQIDNFVYRSQTVPEKDQAFR